MEDAGGPFYTVGQRLILAPVNEPHLVGFAGISKSQAARLPAQAVHRSTRVAFPKSQDAGGADELASIKGRRSRSCLSRHVLFRGDDFHAKTNIFRNKWLIMGLKFGFY